MPAVDNAIEKFMQGLRERNPHEEEFCQAVHEIVASVISSYANVAWLFGLHDRDV